MQILHHEGFASISFLLRPTTRGGTWVSGKAREASPDGVVPPPRAGKWSPPEMRPRGGWGADDFLPLPLVSFSQDEPNPTIHGLLGREGGGGCGGNFQWRGEVGGRFCGGGGEERFIMLACRGDFWRMGFGFGWGRGFWGWGPPGFAFNGRKFFPVPPSENPNGKKEREEEPN